MNYIIKKPSVQIRSYFIFLGAASTYLKKSVADIFANFIILAMLSRDTHRGRPVAENLLLLLKVVEFNPLRRANPEQVKPRSRAKSSIACHTCE